MSGGQVVILFNQITPDSSIDDRDVLIQAKVVGEALAKLGYASQELELTLALDESKKILQQLRPTLVFNLTEMVHNDCQLIHFAPALLDHLKIPYTGCPTEAMFLTSNKLLTRKMLSWAGIRTPEWISYGENHLAGASKPGLFIIQSVWEDASSWLCDDSVVSVRGHQKLADIIRARRRKYQREFFASCFIAGREFHVSLLAGEVTGVSQIVFDAYPPDKFKIYDYRAKWVENSFEYQHTYQNFQLGAEDAALCAKMNSIARRCWEIFRLRGYARLDFRVDEAGEPWLLEINANPCINLSSGFVMAAEQSGISYARMIERIIQDSVAEPARI